MEKLKTLDDILQPDPRQRAWSILNHSTGVVRPRLLSDHYAEVSAIVLHDGVPEEVRNHFQTTRHLCIYSWFVYSFMVVAEFHAFATLELALRKRLPPDSFKASRPPTLRKLLQIAIAENWLCDAALGKWNPRRRQADGEIGTADEMPDAHEYLTILSEALPVVRNAIAHGTHMLWPTRYHSLGLVAAAINALYEQPVGVAVT
jgi:hypothetical protein